MKVKLIAQLLKSGYFENEKIANAWIMNKNVFVNGALVTKSGVLIDAQSEIQIKNPPIKFAGKGGYKLEKALLNFRIEVKSKVVFDAGASTGGFTDCLLQYGAKKVYAVDAGYGQLSGFLRNNKRVSCYEKCNISDFKKTDLDEKIDLCTVDLSYLSLLKAVPILEQLFDTTPAMICLVKPLFEGLQQEKKSNFKEAVRILPALMEGLALLHYQVKQLILSPIFGGRGAIEFLMYIEKAEAIIRPAQSNEEFLKALEQELEKSPPLPFDEFIKTYNRQPVP